MAKKSIICAEYPMSPIFHLSKWKTDFSQFTDEFLKIEEVEYLIMLNSKCDELYFM